MAMLNELKAQLLIQPTDEELELIKAELDEDRNRLENHVKLFKDWVRFQPHLPKDIDDTLIINYIRWCKYDLQKAKKKFELFVVSKHKLTKFYKDRTIYENEFQIYDTSRTVCLLPKLTSEGNRILLVRFASDDPNRFNMLSSLKFICWNIDYLLYEDTHAGLAVLYDMSNFTTATVAKLDFTLMTDIINLLVNVLPFRIKQVNILKAAPLAKPLIMLLKSILSEKLNKRMIIHDTLDDLYEYIPKSLLPAEYGGTNFTLMDVSSRWEEFLLKDESFKEKANKLKLCGQIPEEKRSIFNLEEYGAEGSFRKLQID